MITVTRTIIALLGIGIGCATAYAEQPPDLQDGLHLSKDLRTLLQDEMHQIAEASQHIVMYLASGDWKSIERISDEIQASYVMEKNLTEAQKQELEDKLPDRFKWLDREFHARAGKLGQAAAASDAETVAFHYSRLLESCAACHAAFAKSRFPGFSSKTPEDHHH